MSAQTFTAFKNGGETDEIGWQHWATDILSAGVALGGANATALQATQHGGGANMSVDIQNGAGAILSQAASYPYWVWLSGGPSNASVTAAHPSLARIDSLVMYVDESVTQNVTANNPGAMKFVTVPGTASGSPAAPSGATIQAAVGGSNPYYVLANIAVAAGVTSINTANITDLRSNITYSGNATGGPLNTAGHSFPNAPDAPIALANGWSPLATVQSKVLYTPSTITANGNRSYSLAFNGVDLTALLSPGMRMQLKRSTPAPTQCTNLNGTTQFFSKSSPAGMTFTNNFVISAWVKLTSYAAGTIASRYNGTSGWVFQINASGQLQLLGFNAGSANFRGGTTYQSLPLNKWVHVAMQIDMATFTATPTTIYAMMDGVDVPTQLSQGGTDPTALIQAGNIEIGSQNAGASPWPGKIAQVAIYSAKVTEATILAAMNQTLVGTETNLVSAYTFNNSLNDLNANANNLTANGSATANNADSPYAQGAAAGSLDYGIVMSASFATNTTLVVQVAEGSTIPTSGGLSAISYSGVNAPYGFPTTRRKWKIMAIIIAAKTIALGGTAVWIGSGLSLNLPIGSWDLGYDATVDFASTVAGVRNGQVILSDSGGLLPKTDGVFSQELATRVFSPSGADGVGSLNIETSLDNTVAANIFSLYGQITTATGTETFVVSPGNAYSAIYAKCAYL